MSMFGPKEGTWSIFSKKDPRWNKTGRGYGLVSTCGTSVQHEWVQKCEKKYGKKPDDLQWSFYKD